MPLNIVDTEVEIHTLLTSKDVPMYLWAIRSLIYYAQIQCPVVVHDDGRLTIQDYQSLHHNIPGIKIISKEKADEIVESKLKNFPRCREYRNQSILALKLFDFVFVSNPKSKHIFYFDSDILFFKPPSQIIEHFEHKKKEIIYNCEYTSQTYSSNTLLINSFPNTVVGLNSGLAFFPKIIYDLEKIESIVDWVLQNKNQLPRTDDQLIFAILAGEHQTSPLSLKYSAMLHSKEIEDELICKHYHSVMKYLFTMEGIKSLVTYKAAFLVY